MQRQFQRVAIVNRGEAAMRFIHAAREFNQEHGSLCARLRFSPNLTVMPMFVREADEACRLGAAHSTDPVTTQRRKSSYSTMRRLEHALRQPRRRRVGGVGALLPSTRHSRTFAARWAL